MSFFRTRDKTLVNVLTCTRKIVGLFKFKAMWMLVETTHVTEFEYFWAQAFMSAEK